MSQATDPKSTPEDLRDLLAGCGVLPLFYQLSPFEFPDVAHLGRSSDDSRCPHLRTIALLQ